ncbi:VCBS repeat-containing protein, partial [bacterium]|nr:VCBS repeat-containing protein [bacterium]
MNIRPASNHPLSTCRARRLTLEALEPRCTPVANVVAQTGAANPFASAGSVFTPASALGDLDGDGDLDAVVGMSDGTFAYLRNTGTASAPNFVLQSGAANPFSGIDVGNFADATLGDLDGDGDLDLLAGSTSGTISYFRNTGTAAAPAFAEQTGAANPFTGLDLGTFSSSALGDLDGDGDLDLVGNAENTNLRYFQNTGTAAAPAFAEQTGAANPFAGITGDSYAFPALGDFDGDGKTDLLIGTEFLGAAFYRNTGTVAAPTFTQQTGSANPFNGVNPGSSTQPALGDLDADGDLDTVLGYFSAGTWRLTFYRTNQSPVLTGLSASVTFAENTVNAGAQRLDSGVTISDADGGSFQGGSLTVDNTGTGQEGIGIGTGFGNGITVSGTSFLFNGNTIGTVPASGAGSGLAGNNLVVSFTTAFATPAAVEALIESLTYRNTSDAPAAARTLAVTVNDGAGGTSMASIIVNVTAENDAPAFASTPVTAATEDAAYSYAVTVSDPDAPAQNLTITGTTVPAWLTLTVIGNGTPAASATLTGTPTNADVGDHTVTLTVSDGVASVDQTFTITVANTNDAPTFTSTPVTAATEDAAYSYGVTVADVDPTSQSLTITGTVVPAWLTLNVTGNGTPAASAILTGTPTNADVGDHSVVLTVSDGVTSTQQTFTITVANTNDAPTFTSTPVTAATEDAAYSYG